MHLSKQETKDGYSLQWHGRDSKVLTKHNIVVGIVENNDQIAFAIEAHERYLDIIDRNKQEIEGDDGLMSIDKAHIAAFVVLVVILAVMSIGAS